MASAHVKGDSVLYMVLSLGEESLKETGLIIVEIWLDFSSIYELPSDL